LEFVAIRTALIIALIGLGAPGAAHYYLDPINGNDGTGDGSSKNPWASFTRIFSSVQPGDSALLRPGNYGFVTFGENKGAGTSEGYITYLADPAACAPRADTWYEDSLDRPDTGNPRDLAIFTGILVDLFSHDKNAATKTGTPAGHYIVLEGLNLVGGQITLKSYVSHVVIRNCNVFGSWSEYSSEVTGTGINLYRAFYWGSHFRDILVEGCYVTHTSGGAILLGHFHNVTIRNCHFRHFASSGIRINGVMEGVLLEGNHVHQQVGLADYVKSSHTATAVDGAELNRKMTLDGSGDHWDYATVTEARSGTTELREVESFDKTTRVLVLKEPLSFNVSPGDSVRLWDGTHGSGISVRADNFTLRGCRIHNCGASRGLYFYERAYRDVIIENNLFYSTHNQYTVDLHSYMGNGCKVIHNTFIGTKHENYSGNGLAEMLHGIALTGAVPADKTVPSTIVVANNVFVGTANAPAGAIVKNNIVYAGSGFEEDGQGSNSGNLVYYNDEPAGSEPHPFYQAAGFFTGGTGFDAGFDARHDNNFNAYFKLAPGSDAIGFADPAFATTKDIAGVIRDKNPDAGCYEWNKEASGLLPDKAPFLVESKEGFYYRTYNLKGTFLGRTKGAETSLGNFPSGIIIMMPIMNNRTAHNETIIK
jgi:hypothetical protein